MTRASVAQRLEALADHLDPDLAYELRRLAAADSTAHQLLHAQDRARRAAEPRPGRRVSDHFEYTAEDAKARRQVPPRPEPLLRGPLYVDVIPTRSRYAWRLEIHDGSTSYPEHRLVLGTANRAQTRARAAIERHLTREAQRDDLRDRTTRICLCDLARDSQ